MHTIRLILDDVSMFFFTRVLFLHLGNSCHILIETSAGDMWINIVSFGHKNQWVSSTAMQHCSVSCNLLLAGHIDPETLNRETA